MGGARDPAGEIDLWDARTGKSLLRLKGDATSDLRFSPDGWLLGAAGQSGAYRLWEVETGDDLVSRTSERYSFRGGAAAFSPEIGDIAVGGEDGELQIINVATGKVRHKILACPDGAVGGLAYSPDGKLLATTAGEQRRAEASKGAVQLWDPATGKPVKKLETTVIDNDEYASYRASLGAPAFSPDGSTVVARHATGALFVWDIDTGREVIQLPLAANAFQFSPSGKYLVQGEGKGFVLLELATGKPVMRRAIEKEVEAPADDDPRAVFRRRFRERESLISAIAMSPDGRSVATAMNAKNTVLIWSLDALDKTPAGKLEDREVAALWDQLDSPDAEAAFRAMRRLSHEATPTTTFFKGRLTPAKEDQVKPEQVSALITKLDDDQFAVRRDAHNELKKLGAAAEAQLKKALENSPSIEARRRIEALLKILQSPVQHYSGEPLRRIRAIQVLEWIGDKQAQEVLKALAEGSPTARETKDAKAALARLAMLRKGR
jgi:hypothetical protein